MLKFPIFLLVYNLFELVSKSDVYIALLDVSVFYLLLQLYLGISVVTILCFQQEGLISGQGTKIPHVLWCSQENKTAQNFI